MLFVKMIKHFLMTAAICLGCWVVVSTIGMMAHTADYKAEIPDWNAYKVAGFFESGAQPESHNNPCPADLRDCGTSQAKFATISAIDGNIITFETMDGNLWEVEVGDPSQFDATRFYCVTFDDMGTDDFSDDVIIKAFVEVW